MRTIKFRVWDKLKKQMILEGVEWNIGIILENEDDFELMQFTGLKDKKGKEIFEGDIIRLIGKDKEFLVEVGFERGSFVFYQFKDNFRMEILDFKFIEVIGNKIENPELLEIKKEDEK